MKSTGEKGLALIKNFEGCRLTAYKPVSTEKYYTVGWGHYGSDVTSGMIITQSKADNMLINDLKKYENYVNSKNYVTTELNQNQFDALVSFCYNCGAGNLKKLCYGKTAKQISEQIVLYNKSSGKTLPGLERRRNAEQALFLTAVSEQKIQTAESEDEDMTQEKFNEMMDTYLNSLKTKAPADWSKDARAWAEKEGIIVGDEKGNMNYKSPVTREQLVVFLQRVAK